MVSTFKIRGVPRGPSCDVSDQTQPCNCQMGPCHPESLDSAQSPHGQGHLGVSVWIPAFTKA